VSPVEPYASLRWPTGIAGSDAKAKLAEGVADRVEHLLSSAGAAPRVGLGSGTTSFLTLLALARRRDRLPPGLVLCATSHEMEWYATAAGMAVEPLAGGRVTVAFDGADQVDPAGALIKGRGGAMQRERAVLSAAERGLIVVDATKRVAVLGGCPLPLALRPTGIFATVAAVEGRTGLEVVLRTGSGKDGPVLTESGEVLADLVVPDGTVMTAELDARIRSSDGVADTGYFAPSPTREVVTG
jgi:ribose 5-phosphate isomerase A